MSKQTDALVAEVERQTRRDRTGSVSGGRDPVRRECRGGCGRARYTYNAEWLCRFCLLDRAGRESFRSTRRRLSGRCVVCGGPWPDGTGCEHCPKVTA